MNNFEKQLNQSQLDANLPRWEFAYRAYFQNLQFISNVDNTQKGRILQAMGVDHIIECSNSEQYRYYYVDFMLRERAYPNLFLEYEVDGKPGKFLKPGRLTTHIAYSYRSNDAVQMFNYEEACRYVRHKLGTNDYEYKNVESEKDGRIWNAKGMIIPTAIFRKEMKSYKMIFTAS